MIATAVVMFREVLEAALIISIVLSASRGIPRRGRWIAGGASLGLLSACILAGLTNLASSPFLGTSQAVLNAAVLLCAVVMLTWHNVWMSSHGRQLSADVKSIGAGVQSGSRPLAALLVVTFSAVMREGSEAVLFLWAIATSGENSVAMVFGGLVGAVGGALAGILLYFSLLRIPVRHFFSVTGWLILFLAAGLAAQAAGFLNQASLLPSLGDSIWNTSSTLSQESPVGQLLHILVGYIARPSGIQVVFYIGTFLTVLVLMRAFGNRGSSTRKLSRTT
jgi:high-affinity iron transporter